MSLQMSASMNAIRSVIKSEIKSLGLEFRILVPLCALLFACLPCRSIFTMGGGMRWSWGCPLPFLLVHGETPLHDNWEFGGYNYGPGLVGVLADWMFWAALFYGGSLAAQWVSKKSHGRLRSGFVYTAIICSIAVAYGFLWTQNSAGPLITSGLHQYLLLTLDDLALSLTRVHFFFFQVA